MSSILFILAEEAEYHGSWQHLSREDIDQFRLNCRGVRAAGAANKSLPWIFTPLRCVKTREFRR